MNRFEERVAVVTGGANGIGRASAVRLAEEGAAVWVADVDAAAGADLAAALRDRGRFRRCDVREEAEVEALFDAVLEREGRLDCVAANAGRGYYRPLLGTSLELWHEVLAIDLTSYFLTVRAGARRMQGGGAITVTCSSASVVGYKGLAAYSAGKTGALGLVRVAALELAERGIRVNGVAPGTVETADNAKELADPAFRAGEIAATPLGRLGRPQDIAGTVAFLLSDDAAWLTGQLIVVDGGLTIDAGSHPSPEGPGGA